MTLAGRGRRTHEWRSAERAGCPGAIPDSDADDTLLARWLRPRLVLEMSMQPTWRRPSPGDSPGDPETATRGRHPTGIDALAH